MSGSKKRDPLHRNGEAQKSAKKLKPATNDAEWIRKEPATADAEFAFDSDPIEESPTPEDSGEDDGTSWPSEEDLSDDGGVPLVNPPNGKSPVKLKGSRSDPAPPAKSGTKGTNNDDSRTSHAKQKALAQERKANKANAEVIARAKNIWEKLRRTSMPSSERKILVEELFDIVSGRMKDLVLKHDAGRIIQTALKYSNRAQRRSIAAELKGEYKLLATSKYAKFTIGKLLSSGDEVIRDDIVPEFYGSVRTLIKHPEAGWILDDVYRGAATPVQKSKLLHEWYGAEFAVFDHPSHMSENEHLHDILAAAPEKRAPIMRHLLDLINLLIQKRMTGFTMLHDAMLQYYINLEPDSSAVSGFVDMVTGDEEGDLLKNLAFTASGARLVSLLMAYGNAKDRKLILREYRGHMPTLAFDSHGYKVLVTALLVIDDTVLTNKLIYSELITAEDSDERLLEQFEHLTARTILLLPFVHNPTSIIPNQGHSLLHEVQSIRSKTSKKDPTIRSNELIRSIAPSLLSCIAERSLSLLKSSFGCLSIQEVLLSSAKDLVERQRAIDALISLVDSDRRKTLEGSEISTIEEALDAPAATRLLKTLVYSGHFNSQSGRVELCSSPLGFAPKLYEAAFSKGSNAKELLRWATGLRSFVIEAMLRSEDMPPQYKADLRSRLQSCITELQEAANISTEPNSVPNKGAVGKKKDRTGSGNGATGQEKTNAAVRVGARGAKAILELLLEH
jgi:pumilio homology domain family member 6